MSFDPSRLIKEIYRQADLLRLPPPYVTRVVKLLYLADIEWRRSHGGEPIADLTWRFLHFGPYANELAALLGGPDVEVTELEGGKEARRLAFGDDVDSPMLPGQVSLLIKQLVNKWGGVELNQLLDHVYFDTEPMENAKRYELLDFSHLAPAPSVIQPHFNEAKLKELRSRLGRRVRELALTRNGIHVAGVDVESERAWDDEPAWVPANVSIRHSSE